MCAMMQKFRISSGGVNVRCARAAGFGEVTKIISGEGSRTAPSSHVEPMRRPGPACCGACRAPAIPKVSGGDGGTRTVAGRWPELVGRPPPHPDAAPLDIKVFLGVRAPPSFVPRRGSSRYCCAFGGGDRPVSAEGQGVGHGCRSG